MARPTTQCSGGCLEIPGGTICVPHSEGEDQGHCLELPERTIDGSGLTAEDKHSTVLTDMWQTAKGTSLPAWIQYEFDKPYKLSKILVWNYNGQALLAALGIKQALLEYSVDGLQWVALSGVSEFPMASGTADHPVDITIDLRDALARYVRITAKSNHSGGFYSQCGLSEVRFMAVPLAARYPDPTDGTKEVDPRPILTRRAGREATEHRVYIGTDQQAVADAALPAVTVQKASYGPPALMLGTTYFWRVDEVNLANTPAIWLGMYKHSPPRFPRAR